MQETEQREAEGVARVFELGRAIQEGDEGRAKTLAIEGVDWIGKTTEDFSEMPMSVGEVRSGRSNLARDWTAREALVSMLRDIDSGKMSPEELLIITVERSEGGKNADVRFLRAGPADQWTTAGYLEQIKGQVLGWPDQHQC